MPAYHDTSFLEIRTDAADLPSMDDALPSGPSARLVGPRGITDRDSIKSKANRCQQDAEPQWLVTARKQGLHKRYKWFQSNSVNLICGNDM